MSSLNSSVGSKSSLGRKNLHLLLPTTPEEESNKPLHSSWIRRLRPTAPPSFHSRALVDSSPPSPPAPLFSGDPDSPPVVDSARRSTISNGESRTRASFSSIRSAFFRRLLNFCGEPPEPDGGGFRSFAEFGQFRGGTRRGLLLPAAGPNSVAPPRPWARLPAVDSGGLDRDPVPNSDRIGGFALLRQDSAGVLDRPNYVNCSNFTEEEEEEEEGRKIRSQSGFAYRWIHGKRNSTDSGVGSSSFRQKRASPPVDDHRGGKFRLRPLAQDALNHQDHMRGSRENSFVRSTRDEYAFGELLGEAASLSLHPWHSGNGTSFSSLPRPPMLLHELNCKAQDQRLFEHHSSMDPWHGAVSNLNGSKYTSGAARGGGGCHNMVDDGPSYGGFLDPHLIHHNVVPRKHERRAPAFPTEPDEAFSYWNMGRYKRAKTVSSAFPAFTMNRNSDQ